LDGENGFDSSGVIEATDIDGAEGMLVFWVSSGLDSGVCAAIGFDIFSLDAGDLSTEIILATFDVGKSE
jgi:hypothetical protein